MKLKTKAHKLLSLLMAIIMLISIASTSTFAEQSLGEKQQVTLRVEGQTHRDVLVGNLLLDDEVIEIESGKSVADVVTKLATDKNLNIRSTGEGSNFYLQEIYNLSAGEYGDMSGWTYYIWDENTSKYKMPDVSMGAYIVNKREKVKLVYSIENILYGYQADSKMAKKIFDTLLPKIDKSNMSGKMAAALFNIGEDIPSSYENVVRSRVPNINSSSSMEDYFDIILAILAVGKNPYNVWGRNLIEEVGQRDVLNGSIDDMIFASAIEKAGQFDMSSAKWNSTQIKAKLKTLQNEDGSFGDGTDSEKIVRTARAYSYIEWTSFEQEGRKIEDYLALKMHLGGGFPLDKEDGLITSEVVLALANRSKDTNGRISYRLEGNWKPGGPTPFKAWIDFFLESKAGFKKDLLDKEIDAKTTEIATLAAIRVNKYYNDTQFGGKSLFKFAKVNPPAEEEQQGQKLEKLYEEIVQREKAKNNISPEAAYVLRRMGETLTEEQVEHLEGQLQLVPKKSNVAFRSMIIALAINNEDTKDNVNTLVGKINELPAVEFVRASSANWAIVASNITSVKASDENMTKMNNSLINYKLFKENATGLFLSDRFDMFGAAISLIDKPAEKTNFINNIKKLISEKTSAELLNKNKLAEIVTALNVLGEDIFASSYKTKDGKPIVSALLEADKENDTTFMALASYMLKKDNKGNLFRFEFEKTIDETISDIISEHITKVDLAGHILKKYDDRDIADKVSASKAKIIGKIDNIRINADFHDIVNLIAGSENLRNLESHNLLNKLTQTSLANKKTNFISTLAILNTRKYAVPSSQAENRDSLKEKVLTIKELKANAQGQYIIADAGEALIALAPYYKSNDAEVVSAVNNLLGLIKPAMNNNGTLNPIGANIPHPLPYRSDQLAKLIQGLIHIGIDPHTDERCVKNGKSLIDGLLLYNSDIGFLTDIGDRTKTLQTTKVLETLIDYKLFKENKSLLYNYEEDTVVPVEIKYDVRISILPASIFDANIVVTKKDDTTPIAKDGAVYKLVAGDYTVKAEKAGYKPKTQNFTVSSDTNTHNVSVTLEAVQAETPFIFDAATNTIKGYKTKEVPTNLVIPAEINGVAVKYIGNEAFRYSDTASSSKVKNPIVSLTLPEGLETIEKMAFQGNEFTEITIPASLKAINGGFRLCKKLETVNFAPNSNLEVVGEDAFYGTAIKQIDLPQSVKIIGVSAFHSSDLKNIVLPEGIKEIKSSAFALSKVQEIIFPEGVEKINFDSRDKQGVTGLFYRTFGDDARQQLSFTRVFDKSGKADGKNTRAIVNPVEVTIKYQDALGNEITSMPTVKAVGVNKKQVTQFPGYNKELLTADGDGSYILDFKNPYTDTKAYTDDSTRTLIFANYFTKGSEWTFVAPEIAGYTKPVDITKTFANNKEEVVFVYQTNSQKYNLALEGDGLTSEPQAGELSANTSVKVIVSEPTNKTFKKLLVNNVEVTPTKEGIKYIHTFVMDGNKNVKVEYDNATYQNEIELSVDKTELKLGEKAKITLKYRNAEVAIINPSIDFEYNPDILKLDNNTGEVTAIGSGTVVLTAKLKDSPSVKAEQSVQVAPTKVKLRVEAVERTLIPLQEVEIKSLVVKKDVDYYENITFKNPTVFLAVKEALKAKGVDTSVKEKFDFSSNGNWMVTVDSLKATQEYGNNSSYMFAVNHIMADQGAGEYKIKDNDNVVIYIAKDWTKNEGYSHFENENYQIRVGEELSIKLRKTPFDMNSGTSASFKPVVGAKLLKYDGTALKDASGQDVISDSNGVFKYTFTEAGDYAITASKILNGIEQISRPYAVVKVEANNQTPQKTITSILPIADKTVENGTEKSALGLPANIEATLSDNSKVNLTLTWDNGTPVYNKTEAGEYTFKADYILPSAVTGAKPEVKAKVVVKQATVPTPPQSDIESWAEAKTNLITDFYDSKEELKDWWAIAEIGKLGKEIKPKDLDFIFTKSFDRDGVTIKKAGSSIDVGNLSKTILALSAAGLDPENYFGHNLIAVLMEAEGGTIWQKAPRVWALGTGDYSSTQGWSAELERSVGELLDMQNSEGLWDSGWGWHDSTGFALYALAPLKDKPSVKNAVEKAVNGISTKMRTDGDLENSNGRNVNSLAMVVGGLLSIDANYLKDSRLVKDGKTLFDGLKIYEVEGQPEFVWKLDNPGSKAMATEQTYRALVTYKTVKAGNGYVFDYKNTPKRAVSNIAKPIADITVLVGTEKENLGLPSKAKIKFANGKEAEVDLTFGESVPAYDKDTQGAYVFKAEYTMPADQVGNKPEISVKVFVKPAVTNLTIASIEAIADKTVANGTEKSALGLPATVEATLSDNSKVNLTLTWDNGTPEYNKTEAREYTFKANYELPSGVTGAKPEVSAKVVVKPAAANLTITSIEAIADKTVENGTEKSALGLPAAVEATLSDNSKVNITLTWDNGTPEYNKANAGEYVFKAEYELPSGVIGAKPEVSAKIIVKDLPMIASIMPISPITVEVGTEENEAINKLPKTAVIRDDNNQMHSVNLAWTVENYNKDVEAEYNAVGTFTLPQNVKENPSIELKVATTIKVAQSSAPQVVDKSELTNLVNSIENENLDQSKFTRVSYKALTDALNKAKAVLSDANANQDEVNQAKLLLENAKANLVEKADTTELLEAIATATEKLRQKHLYRDDDVQKVEKAIEEANTLMEDETVSIDAIKAKATEIIKLTNEMRKKSSGGGGSANNDILVYFMLQGRKYEGEEREVWIKRKPYMVPAGSKVLVLFDKALTEHKIEYNNKGNYIDTIKSPIANKWQGEFTNGSYSGWMYRVNGQHTLLGLEQYILKENDDVFWFYTNDYRKEPGSQEWNPGQPLEPTLPMTEAEQQAQENKNKPGGAGGAGGATGEQQANAPLNTPIETLILNNKFKDIAEDKWYTKPVLTLVEKNIIRGKAEDIFAPNESITRAEFLVLISRIKPFAVKNQEGKFSDVKADAWYSDAIVWANENGIANGYGKTFNPNGKITREELAVMLYNYIKYNKDIQLTNKNSTKAFADNDSIAEWSKQAVTELQKLGILGGKENNKFGAKDAVTRAEVATVIYRLLGLDQEVKTEKTDNKDKTDNK